MSVFPTPASHVVTIELPAEFSVNSAYVVDSRGNYAKSVAVVKGSGTLQVAILDLANGVYFVVAEEMGGEKKVAKFIVQH